MDSPANRHPLGLVYPRPEQYYFNLDSKQPASSIVSTPQPSQLSSSHSPFAPSIPPGFSSVSSQPLYASTFVHPQSSNARSHSQAMVIA